VIAVGGGFPSPELVKRLAEEIREAGLQGLVHYEVAEGIANALLGKSSSFSVQLIVPRRVSTSLSSSLADLGLARCVRCGHVYNLALEPKLLKSLRCPKCGSNAPLVPAPIWCITTKDKVQSRAIKLYTTGNVRLVYSAEDYFKIRHKQSLCSLNGRIVIRDLSRPIANLLIKYSSGIEDPLPIFPFGQFRYWLSIAPSESITKPVTITAFAYNEEDCTEIKPSAPLPGISEILFCKGLELLQATILYRAGHQRSATSSRVQVIDAQQSQLFSGMSIRIPVRYIRTCGLVLRIDEEYVEEVLSELGYQKGDMWTALHTISHAFLVKLPQVTGLDGTDFGEAISATTNEVAVFDNAPGGVGGIEGVVKPEEGRFDPNYEPVWYLREVVDCPLACIKACKACLFTSSCFMLNWKLDRRILLRLGWRDLAPS